ncbi:MAG TPA: outer membrane beta-barrel protein, partial [Panacibacter sp.]|nr:outer membrane beta-barrel protein [Panacibacter sp.]
AFFPPNTPVPPYLYANFYSEGKFGYLELPILLKANFSLGETLSFFLNGGPYFGYLLNAKSITSGSSNIYLDDKLTQPFLPAPVSFDQTMDIKNDLKKFNFGIQGGIGLALNLPNENELMLTLGGNYGLIHIQKDEANGKNSIGAATATLAYLIKL